MNFKLFCAFSILLLRCGAFIPFTVHDQFGQALPQGCYDLNTGLTACLWARPVFQCRAHTKQEVQYQRKEGLKCVCFFFRLTSAYPLFLPGQDSRSINDTDALQHGVRHLGAHEPGWEREQYGAQKGEKESKKKRERESTRTVSIGNRGREAGWERCKKK